MISVTLNFATIEAARKVLLEIPESALVGAPAAAPALEKPKADKPKAEPKVEKPAPVVEEPKADPKPVATEATQPAAQPAPTASSDKPAAVDYPTLQKSVFALAGKSREAAAAVAQSFGVKTFKELPEAKWADALEAVNGKIAELEAA